MHTWVTRKSCFKSVFYGQKAKNAAKIEFVAVFNWWTTISYPCAAQHFFAACG